MKRSGKVLLCAVIYVAAIAGLSVGFIRIGEPGNAPGTITSAEVPPYQAELPGDAAGTLDGWARETGAGEEHWISPDGASRFIVTRAAAYQKDLEAYAKANVGAIEIEDVEMLSALARGEIGGRETYICEYADLGQEPAEYRKIYIFNTEDRTYGVMGTAASRDALEEIGFDSIVADYQFE